MFGGVWSLTHRFTLEGQPGYVVVHGFDGNWSPDSPNDGPWGRRGWLTLQGSLNVRGSGRPSLEINLDANVYFALCGVDRGILTLSYTYSGRTCTFTLTVDRCGNSSGRGGCS